MARFFAGLADLAKDLGDTHLFVLACLGILAWVVIRVAPAISKAVVDDRKNKRTHTEKMTGLSQKLTARETRKGKQAAKAPPRQKGSGQP